MELIVRYVLLSMINLAQNRTAIPSSTIWRLEERHV
jgi:hypothetical protein